MAENSMVFQGSVWRRKSDGRRVRVESVNWVKGTLRDIVWVYEGQTRRHACYPHVFGERYVKESDS